MSSAFVGVSLDSRHFTEQWWTLAFDRILNDHDRLVVFIADELLRYTRTVGDSDGRSRAEFERSNALVERRYEERCRHIQKMMVKSAEAKTGRVSLFRYRDFSDHRYADIHRKLRIAFSALPGFRDAVVSEASAYVRNRRPLHCVPGAVAACCDFTLDEIAMCLRLTEVEGYHFEYNPHAQLPILTYLYEDKFAIEGLSVSDLTGIEGRRVYTVLTV